MSADKSAAAARQKAAILWAEWVHIAGRESPWCSECETGLDVCPGVLLIDSSGRVGKVLVDADGAVIALCGPCHQDEGIRAHHAGRMVAP